jgi:hypothetical protein
MVERALAKERLEHRRLRLLDLQEQRIGLVAAEHEHDPGARADAAHADHLARRVRIPIPLEQPPAVGAEGPAVGADDTAQELLELSRLEGWTPPPRSGR